METVSHICQCARDLQVRRQTKTKRSTKVWDHAIVQTSGAWHRRKLYTIHALLPTLPTAGSPESCSGIQRLMDAIKTRAATLIDSTVRDMLYIALSALLLK